MFGPTRMTYDIATSRHHERLAHSARIQELKQARTDGRPHVHRPTQRRLTSARLAGALAAVKAALAW